MAAYGWPETDDFLVFCILVMSDSIGLQHGAAFRVLACAGDGLLFRITSGSHNGGDDDDCAYYLLSIYNNNDLLENIKNIEKENIKLNTLRMTVYEFEN